MDEIVSQKHGKSFVPTINRTFRVLESLAVAEDGRGISELSTELGIAKSTMFNILTTLAQLGYIYRSGTDNKFHLSLKLFSLGSSVVERMDLRKVAASILQDLVTKTGETANLGTIQGNEAVYIDCLTGPQPVTVITWPGKRLPLHTTALGKALLAWLPAQEAKSILSSIDMQSHSSNVIISIDELMKELSTVRDLCYAIDNEEDAEGMRCVGAPIFDNTGHVIAAISLTAPIQRMPLENIPETAELVVYSAHQISLRLGFDGILED